MINCCLQLSRPLHPILLTPLRYKMSDRLCGSGRLTLPPTVMKQGAGICTQRRSIIISTRLARRLAPESRRSHCPERLRAGRLVATVRAAHDNRFQLRPAGERLQSARKRWGPPLNASAALSVSSGGAGTRQASATMSCHFRAPCSFHGSLGGQLAPLDRGLPSWGGRGVVRHPERMLLTHF